jgi:hypothetical protein
MVSRFSNPALPLTAPPTASGRPWYAKAFYWITAPFVDGQEGLSLTRFLAIYFAILVGHLVEHQHAITANTLWLALASIATAFGKSTFTFLLRRLEMRSVIAQSDTTSETHVVTEQKVIEERRDPVLGIEPTP